MTIADAHAIAIDARAYRCERWQQAVRDAAETFADFARFAITRKGEYYEVAVSEIDADVDGDVVAEFCNHALANTMARKRKKV